VKLVIGIIIVAGILLASMAIPSPWTPSAGALAPPPSSTPSKANCAQGSHSIHLAPPSGSATAAILAAYNQIGSEGGGTVYLDQGTFTLDSTLNLQGYGNVTIQGDGEGATVVQMEPNPVGKFTATNGSTIGRYPHGVSANMIEISGTQGPIWNFELCDLTINANANTAKEAWRGSLIYDYSGGRHHVYSDVAETGFFGPSTTPNGLHLEPSPAGVAARGYVVNGLVADDNSLAFEQYAGYAGGPNFLNIGPIDDCHITNVTGIGLVALEVAPSYGCFFGYWSVSGHMLIDPSTGGSWGGSVFAHIIVSENGTAAPNALQVDVASKTAAKPFSAMQWTDDAFYGPVLDGNNMLWVTHSRFDGGINALPAHFTYDTVIYTNPGPDRIGLPIHVDGTPAGGRRAVVTHDVFRFLNDTSKRSPLWLAVPNVVLEADTFTADAARATGLAASSPLKLSSDSCFVGLTYKPSGTATRQWKLIDLEDSLGFIDGGAWVARLTHITNDLPPGLPLSASCHDLSSHGIHQTVSQPSTGPTAFVVPARATSGSAAPAPALSAAGALERIAAWVEQLPIFAGR
jgi:hypothetical protein